MNNDKITALAREYAEFTDISEVEKKHISAICENFLKYTLRRYALVGKSKVRQWIGVNERLPEIRKRVLICHRTADGYRVAIGKRVPSPHPDGWEWNSYTKEEVITWMPLPDFPEIAKEVEE